MKIQLEIDEQELKDLVLSRAADKIIDYLFEPPYDVPYEQRDAIRKKRLEDILKKIDWKNAGKQLSETVVQKFFTKLLDK